MEALISPDLPTAAITAVRDRLQRVEGRCDALLGRQESLRLEVKDLEAEDEILDLVAGLFRTLIDAEVTANVRAVERLLTEGIQAVFEDMDIGIKALVDVQRGKVSVELLTVQKQPNGSYTEGSAMDAYGGSIATVQSVLLRVIVILRRGMRPLMLLDESLGAVAEHYVPAVGRFLSLLCDRVGMDMLSVTHNQTLIEAAKKAYRIHKVDGAAGFREKR